MFPLLFLKDKGEIIVKKNIFILSGWILLSSVPSAYGGEHGHPEEAKKRSLFSSIENYKQAMNERLEKMNITKDSGCLGWDFSKAELNPNVLVDSNHLTSKAMDRLLPDVREKIVSPDRITALVIGNNIVLPASKLNRDGNYSVIEKTRYAEYVRFLTANFEQRANDYIKAKQNTQTFWGKMDLLGLNVEEEQRELINLVAAVHHLRGAGAPTPIVQEVSKRLAEIFKGKKPSNITAFNSIPLRLPSVVAPGQLPPGCSTNTEEILQVQSDIVLGQNGNAKFRLTRNGAKATTTIFDKTAEQVRLATKANNWTGKAGKTSLSVTPTELRFTPSQNDKEFLRVTMAFDDGNVAVFPRMIKKSDLEAGQEIELNHIYEEGNDFVVAAQVKSSITLHWDKDAKTLYLLKASSKVNLRDRRGSETDEANLSDLKATAL